jgi:signal transduction histidine kinase
VPLSTLPGALDDGLEAPTNILIVDDLPEKLLIFETILDELNQNLVFARSGNEALREVMRQEFAVILLDVNMPDIDGLETARLIRRFRRSAHTPIIFITAYADEMQTARGYALGAVDYIMSPVVPEILRSKVRVFVELQIMERRVRRQADERVALAAAEAARAAAEENTRRADYLAHCGAELGASLDVDVGMRKLLMLLVPRLAARALLVLLGDRAGEYRALLCRPSSQSDGLRFVARDHANFSAQVRAALEHVIDAGQRLTVPGDALGIDPAQHAGLGLPLVAGSRAIGVLVLPLDEQLDRGLIGELADRAANAFENVRLFRSLQAEIADRKQAEARLRESHQRKDEFLAMLSHELRNPLAPIRNAVDLIRRLAPQEPRLAWAVDVAQRQVVQLTRLVEELLDVARISQGKISLQTEPIDLREVVLQAIESARPAFESRGHRFVQQLPDLPVWMRGDAARLAQVVGNLLTNAAKYTPNGGHVALALAVEEGSAVIRVTDDGVGIDAELLPGVFELFRQGKRSLDRSQGGLGIGLTLVQRLVELHHGSVEAFSAGPGRGSEFRVTLPCLHEVLPARALPSGHDGTAADAPRARVLVVDDNADAAQTVAIYLELAGHEVCTAADGREALEAARRFQPQAVLLDIGLPGMDGFDVARALRRLPQSRDALLVALTGYGRPDDALRAIEAGFDEHFVKPADLDRLLQRLDQWLQSTAHAPNAGNGAGG